MLLKNQLYVSSNGNFVKNVLTLFHKIDGTRFCNSYLQYFDLETASLLKSSRKMKLLNWGFDCHCDICDLKEDALEENEKLRKQLQSAKTALKKCPTDLLDTKSLKQQMTIEKLIIKIIRDLQSQLKGIIRLTKKC